MNESRINFVISHYKPGMKSTNDALKSVYCKAGYDISLLSLLSWRRIVMPAMAFAAILVLVLFLHNTRQNSWSEYYADSNNSIVILADGTKVTLAPGSSMKIQKRKNPRHVEMDGKAYFEVFHNEDQPFTVSAGEGRITVLGTKFLVKTDARGTGVDVCEGKVRFTCASSELNGHILTKGMSGILAPGESEPLVLKGNMLNPQAWATGIFVYENAMLSDALSELSSYYNVHLDVVPESASTRRFSGKFSTDSIDDIVYSVQTALGVEILVR